MNKSQVITFVSIVGLAAIAAMSLPMARAATETGYEHPREAEEMDMKKNIKAKGFSIDRIHSKHLPAVSKSIDKAIKAVKSGDKKAALDELHKAQKMIVAINEAIGKQVKAKFVNNRCPMMGSPIIPSKVTEKLTRVYKGQQVAFCCAGCPSKWDKLTDAEKETKLAKSKPKSAEHHSPEPAEYHEEKGHKAQEHAPNEQGHGAEHVEALRHGANRMCPMMPDKKVDPSLYVDYKGKRIYVCCKKCAKRVKENPAAWYTKVYGDGHDH